MPKGPGKYDAEATSILKSTNASTVMLIVLEGDRGEGFSVVSTTGAIIDLDTTPRFLRRLADHMEADLDSGSDKSWKSPDDIEVH